MPKTTKRTETKRAERIARAHASPVSQDEESAVRERRKPSGNKSPMRGIARYPWASIIVLCLVILGVVVLMDVNHFGPFALHTATKPAKSTTPIATATTTSSGVSPCVSQSILSSITKTGAGPSASDIAKINHTYSSAPKSVTDVNKIYCAGINTNRGLIVVELDPKLAPNTVNNFVFLAQNHFYDGLTFHRVIKDANSMSIAQGGDPKGDGTGGPGYQFNDEPVQGDYTAGTIAMANSGANTNGSQFFINTGDNSKVLQKNYNLFGKVVQGLDVAQKLVVTGNGVKPDVMNYIIVTAAP